MEQQLEIEYHSDTPEFDDELKAKVEKRLAKLTKRNRDITGVSLAVHTASGDTQPKDYRVRMVVYRKPDNVAATGSSSTVAQAVADALGAVERQVRELREQQRSRHRRA